jgi:hypothetical protein
MKKTRNGKIARLPQVVREELNQRLERSEPSPQLLAWLNALPEVQEFVQRECGGEPVSKQNLSRWRLGGYQDWLTRRDFFDDARTAGDFAAGSGEGRKSVIPDQAATVLAARYAGLLVRWDGECTKDFEARARVLNGLCRGVTELQREARRANRDNPGPEQPAQSRPVTVSHGDTIVEKPLTGNSWQKPGDSG